MAPQLRFCPALSPDSISFTSPRHILPPLSLFKIPSTTSSSSSLLSQCFYPISSCTFHHHHIQSTGGGRGSTEYTGGSDGGVFSDDDGNDDHGQGLDGFGPIRVFLNGWRSRVATDPQFPFKVLMEKLAGVTACMLGDMATHPDFGLNELDFIFSTLGWALFSTFSSCTSSLPPPSWVAVLPP